MMYDLIQRHMKIDFHLGHLGDMMLVLGSFDVQSDIILVRSACSYMILLRGL